MSTERFQWSEIEACSRLSRADIESAASVYRNSKAVIACYGMGLTQHRSGVLSIQMLTNLLLMRGNIGKPGAGIFPVRGHSNVQGQRTVGITEKPELVPLDRLAEQYGFDPPRERGLDTVRTCEAVRDGSVKAFISLGGNFIRAIPETHIMERVWRQLQLTVQIVTKLNRGALVHGRAAYLLPCLGRIEIDRQETGVQFVTVEDTTGRFHASHGQAEPAGENILSEPKIVAELAKAILVPNPKVDWLAWSGDYGLVRDAIADTYPAIFKDFNERIKDPAGFDRPLPPRERKWMTPNGKANFISPHSLSEDPDLPRARAGVLTLMTLRSNDQFNTTVYGLDDRLRGINGTRMVVLMNVADIEEHGLRDGDEIDLLGAEGARSSALCVACALSLITCRRAHVPATIPNAIRCCRYGITRKEAACRQRNPSRSASISVVDHALTWSWEKEGKATYQLGKAAKKRRLPWILQVASAFFSQLGERPIHCPAAKAGPFRTRRSPAGGERLHERFGSL